MSAKSLGLGHSLRILIWMLTPLDTAITVLCSCSVLMRVICALIAKIPLLGAPWQIFRQISYPCVSHYLHYTPRSYAGSYEGHFGSYSKVPLIGAHASLAT